MRFPSLFSSLAFGLIELEEEQPRFATRAICRDDDDVHYGHFEDDLTRVSLFE